MRRSDLEEQAAVSTRESGRSPPTTSAESEETAEEPALEAPEADGSSWRLEAVVTASGDAVVRASAPDQVLYSAELAVNDVDGTVEIATRAILEDFAAVAEHAHQHQLDEDARREG